MRRSLLFVLIVQSGTLLGGSQIHAQSVALVISGTSLSGRCGAVKLKTTLINTSDLPLVVAPQDVKEPDSYSMGTNWTVVDEYGRTMAMQQLLICPVRPRPQSGQPWFQRKLKNSDVLILKPGEKHDLGEEDPTMFLDIRVPGKYTVTRFYSYEPPHLTKQKSANGIVVASGFDISRLAPTKRAALRSATGFWVASNPLTIDLQSSCKNYGSGEIPQPPPLTPPSANPLPPPAR